MAFPRAQAIEHVCQLAKDYGLRITWVTPWWEAGTTGERGISIPRPYSGKLYLVALHEIGHYADPMAVKHWETTRVRDYFISEAAATGWAIEHAAPHIMEEMGEDDFEYLGMGMNTHGADLVKRRRAALLR